MGTSGPAAGRAASAEALALVDELFERGRRPIVRVLTCGSVDDGKSTLLGRLLYDTGAVLDDHLAAARVETEKRGNVAGLDFALLVDGLQAEREQGITIDIAYRYLFMRGRRFLLIDAPGHERYTRNMATGASQAQVALLLVDAERGVRPQTRRHLCIAALLGVKSIVVAINKMDLVGHSEQRFTELRHELESFAHGAARKQVWCIPVAALHGDNVVHPGDRMPWYAGPTLAQYLDGVDPEALGPRERPFRLVVQGVSRVGIQRVVLGTVAGGTLRVDDEVVSAVSGVRGRVVHIMLPNGPARLASAGQAIGITLEGELDVGRGEVISHVTSLPTVSDRFVADLLWFATSPLEPGRSYWLKLGTRMVEAVVNIPIGRLEPDTLTRSHASTLLQNEIGRATVELSNPLAFDPYESESATGAFLMIDALTCETVGAGMVVEAGRQGLSLEGRAGESSGLPPVTRDLRAARVGHVEFLVWVHAAEPGEALARARRLERELFTRGALVTSLTADWGAAPPTWPAVARALLTAGLGTIVASEVATEPTELQELLGTHHVLVTSAADVHDVTGRLEAAGWIPAQRPVT